MLDCFIDHQEDAVPVTLITAADYSAWLNEAPGHVASWLKATNFRADANEVRMVPDQTGKLAAVICGVGQPAIWSGGHLANLLPEGNYFLATADSAQLKRFALAWGLGAYQFSRYKKPTRKPAKLYLPATISQIVQMQVESIYLTRDLINTPTEDMGPSELAASAEKLAQAHGATFNCIVGYDLLKQQFNAIHTVGRASDDAPRLIDIFWGDAAHPKLTLVGKGVCFDSGGLDIKPSSAMLLMKKDMGGAAQVLGLASMIMRSKLPVRLRVLIPAVENVISGNAYRPGDVITMRSGMTVEVGNTDAEGRLVLADALNLAVEEKPDLLIDMSTLTGAARVALGTDLPAMFSNRNDIAQTLQQLGEETEDYVWQLPLFSFYRDLINSQVAEISNNSMDPYAGAITAALFLQAFVPAEIPWLHFDLMAWNLRPRPGRPQGGEAQAIRTLFAYLQKRYR